jgi:hypothetical protein
MSNVSRKKPTRWKRPDDPRKLLRGRKPHTYRFKDDGLIPNHPKWPLVIYKSAIRLPNSLDPAAVFEGLFESNGWGDSWRDASTTMLTTTRASTKCSASRAAGEHPHVKAKRAKSTTVVFVALGESGVSHCCSWCGKFANGKPKGCATARWITLTRLQRNS